MNSPSTPHGRTGEMPPDYDTVIPMIRCRDCGHMVPEQNVALHQATGCGVSQQSPHHFVGGRDSISRQNGDVAQTGMHPAHLLAGGTPTRAALPPQPPAPTPMTRTVSADHHAAQMGPPLQSSLLETAGEGTAGWNLESPTVVTHIPASSRTIHGRDFQRRYDPNGYRNCGGSDTASAIDLSSPYASASAPVAEMPADAASVSSTASSSGTGVRRRRPWSIGTRSPSLRSLTGMRRNRQRQQSDKSDATMSSASSSGHTMPRQTSVGTTSVASSYKSPDDDEDVVHLQDVVNLADEEDNEEEVVIDADCEVVEGRGEWPCPRCTLLNPLSQNRCEACQYHNAAIAGVAATAAPPEEDPATAARVRAADPTRRERLIGDVDPLPADEQQLSPNGAMVGSAAILGSVLGAAGAYVRGRPVTNGALEGAVSGAVGGAIVGEVLRDIMPPNESAHRTLLTEPRVGSQPGRSTAAARSASMPIQGAGGRAQPRPSVRVIRRPNGRGGHTLTAVTHGGPAGQHGPVDPAALDMLVSSLLRGGHDHAALHDALRSPTGGRPADGTSYERLLQMFGDGTENRGADPSTIQSLPTSIIGDVEKELPVDRRQCSVCLEDFKRGDRRRTLPCLHGFHEGCIDRWLGTNASCPICKHEL